METLIALKYGMANRKLKSLPKAQQVTAKKKMKSMKKYIQKKAWQNVLNGEINWKNAKFKKEETQEIIKEIKIIYFYKNLNVLNVREF